MHAHHLARPAFILLACAVLLTGCPKDAGPPAGAAETAGSTAGVAMSPTEGASESGGADPSEGQPTSSAAAASNGASPSGQSDASGDEPTSRATSLTELLLAGKWDQAHGMFDETMAGALPPDKLEETFEAVTSPLGAFQGIVEVRVEEAGTYTMCFVTTAFALATFDVKVVLDDAGRIAGLFFLPTPPKGVWKAPDYADPQAFEEIPLTIGSGDGALPAMLSKPIGSGPFPGIVLVHGSGPQDMDETIGPNKPFKDLAWGLATRGVAVLRYDKRTKAHQAVLAKDPSLVPTVREESIDDAVEAVGLLASQTSVDPERVFVLGHSLGGMLVPRIAPLVPGAKGFVILAGSTRPLGTLILEQLGYIFGLDGTMTPYEKETLAAMEGKVALATSDDLTPSTSASDLPLGVPASYWIDLRTYDVVAAAKVMTRPVMVVQGLRDYQVTEEDLEGWKTAFAGKKHVVINTYGALDHLMRKGKGMATPSDYQSTGSVAQKVVDDIATWVTSLP